MAREWIKWMKGLSRRTEIRAIARKLDIPRQLAAGCFMDVMEWADDETVDGVLPRMTVEDLDDAAGMKGFGQAMVDVGWATATDQGVTLSNFTRHNGETAKKRALDANRQRAVRDPSAKCHASSVTENGQVRDQNKKRREEDKKNPPNPPAGGADVVLPAALDTEAFRAAWDEYLAYRRERRLPAMRPRTVAAKLAEMATWGEPTAREAIRQSIANGWQGVFEPKPTDARGRGRMAPVRPETPEESRKRSRRTDVSALLRRDLTRRDELVAEYRRVRSPPASMSDSQIHTSNGFLDWAAERFDLQASGGAA